MIVNACVPESYLEIPLRALEVQAVHVDPILRARRHLMLELVQDHSAEGERVDGDLGLTGVRLQCARHEALRSTKKAQQKRTEHGGG